MFDAPERRRTFSTVITTPMVQDLNEKSLALIVQYDALVIHCVARIVAEPFFLSEILRIPTPVSIANRLISMHSYSLQYSVFRNTVEWEKFDIAISTDLCD
jgi:hypothetical protein